MTAGERSDAYTAAAIAILAMCVVTIDHEAIGHGGACLAAGGKITTLTSSIFHCDVRSIWITPMGPLCNLIGGVIALLMLRRTPRTSPKARLFFTLVAAFAFFWESGYLVYSVITRNGDWYFTLRDFAAPSRLLDGLAIAIGAIAYGLTVRITATNVDGSRVARIAWLSATVAAIAAASLASTDTLANIRDGALEIGAASVPLLFARPVTGAGHSALPITRSAVTIAVSVIVFVVFAMTLGRGVHF